MGTAVETIMTTCSPFVNSKGGGGGACGHTEMKTLCKAASDTAATTTTTSAAIADMVENLSKFTFTVPVTVQQPEKEGGEEEEEEILTKCECCGLAEECTSAYIEQTKKIFCGHFVCGLCSEAVKEESRRLGPEAGMEDALLSHMKVCIKFNTFTRADPAAHLAMAMRQILRRSVELGETPRPKGRLWQRTALSRSETFTVRGQRKSLP
ncbi:hypothetical protein BDL97_01G169900 [Sphagnum fallax]|nr:hypothetical protein BDL97_01G169900 [Sphagnum fallax]